MWGIPGLIVSGIHHFRIFWFAYASGQSIAAGEPGFLEAPFDGNERSGQAVPTTAGRSGTWITVIANGRVEESVPTFDFMVRQNFGEPQLNESSHYKHWREVRDSRRYQTTRVPKLVCHSGVLSIQDYSRGRSIAT